MASSKPPAPKPSNKPTEGDDVLTGNKVGDSIHGLGGNDQISGGDGNDRLWGDDGNDSLFGQNGNDMLWGGSGNDRLDGGAGNDSLNGGAGADILTGGSGADNFDFESFSDSSGTSVDRITDYNRAEGDSLVFAALDANSAMPGLQGWTYVSQLGAFPLDGTGQATLTYDPSTNTTTLNLYNADGDTDADFTLLFDGQYGAGSIQLTILDMVGGAPDYNGIIYPGS